MNIGNGYIITMKKEVFHRTASGKSWKSKPDYTSRETVEPKFYNNYIDSCRFFNNFPGAAYCRKSYGYTYAGYIPVSVVTVSPDGETKIIARFGFDIIR